MKKEFVPEDMITILEALERISSRLAPDHEEPDVEAHNRVVSWIQNECYSRRLTAYLFSGGWPYRINFLRFADTEMVEEICRTGTYTMPAPLPTDDRKSDGRKTYSVRRLASFEDLLYEISGRVLFKRAELDRLLAVDAEATSDSSGSPSGVEEGRYCPPYIAFMLQGVEALQLSADERADVEIIKDWIKENWPESFGRLSDNLTRNMVTMMRRPSDAKGGNSLWKKRQ